MRTSQIAMIAAAGVLLLLTVGALVGLRYAISSVLGESEGDVVAPMRDPGDSAARAFALDDFDGIRVEDAWKIEVVESGRWSVEVAFPENLGDGLNVEVRDGLLVLESGQTLSRGWWGGHERRFSARIGMPSLRRIVVEGTADLDFSGFDEDRLEVIVTGAANIEARDSAYEHVGVTVSGASNVDFRALRAVNAEVDLSGASNVRLNMNGGVLTGEMSGIGYVKYAGDVSEESVKVAGFGRVHPGF